MSTEQSESAPAAVTAPQVETKAAPAAAADVTQQATTPTATTQRVKNPKRVGAGKMVAERTRLAREEQKKAAEAYQAGKKDKAAAPEAPVPAASTEGESPRAAASAPTNGSLLAASAFPCSGSITSVKSSRQWPRPRSTNSKRRSPRMSSQNLFA